MKIDIFMQSDGSHAAGFSSAQRLLQPSCIYTACSELVLQSDNRTKSIGLTEALRLIEGILVHTMSDDPFLLGHFACGSLPARAES